MSNLSEIYIKRETLKTLLDVVSKKDEKGVSITISTNEETNEYGQNVSAFVSQPKEDRDAKKKKFYVGNGKVFWTDGKISVAKKNDESNTQSESIDAVPVDDFDDLPF